MDDQTRVAEGVWPRATSKGAIWHDRWLAADVFAPDGAGSTRLSPTLPPVHRSSSPRRTSRVRCTWAMPQRTAVEDLMVRHARMRGHPTLFLPGLDHASIAAQFVLDGILAKDGESRQSLGRDRYLERMRVFVAETREIMLGQQRRVGARADWGRLGATRWTRAPQRPFASPSSGSIATISPIGPRRSSTGARDAVPASVTSRWYPTPETGTLWSIRYHLIDETSGEPDADPGATITVATTRPETILGDTAVAVHPDDDRYRSLVGRHVRIPFVERDVPVIADDIVERAFGTGAVKVTPAHDPDDHATGKRHGLSAPTILADDASDRHRDGVRRPGPV